MSKLKPYLEYLDNHDEIEQLAQDILELELSLDKLGNKKTELENHLKELKSQKNRLLSSSKDENEINELSNEKNNEITSTQSEISSTVEKILKTELELRNMFQVRQEAIRRGMADLFHQAKVDYEKARMDWIKYSELSLQAHERMKKKKKDMDAVKHAFKAEFE